MFSFLGVCYVRSVFTSTALALDSLRLWWNSSEGVKGGGPRASCSLSRPQDLWNLAPWTKVLFNQPHTNAHTNTQTGKLEAKNPSILTSKLKSSLTVRSIYPDCSPDTLSWMPQRNLKLNRPQIESAWEALLLFPSALPPPTLHPVTRTWKCLHFPAASCEMGASSVLGLAGASSGPFCFHWGRAPRPLIPKPFPSHSWRVCRTGTPVAHTRLPLCHLLPVWSSRRPPTPLPPWILLFHLFFIQHPLSFPVSLK